MKKYYEDAYKTKFLAKVVSCEKQKDKFNIILDQTYFYPEGGGQPADKGYIGGLEVTDVREIDDMVVHIVDSPLEIGSQVECSLDFERRYSFMQRHTAEHIISGIIKKKFGYDNVGFHMGGEYTTLDTNGELTKEQIEEIEELANEAIYKNIKVSVNYPLPQELKNIPYRSKKELTGDVRIVTIEDYDICACCGIHCDSTLEIGIIKLVTFQKYKGGTRIFMLCGDKARKDYSQKNNNIYKISALLSSKPTETPMATEQLLSELAAIKQQLVTYKTQIFSYKADSISADTKVVFEENLDSNDLKNFCLMLQKKLEVAAVFSMVDENSYKYAIASETIDVSLLGKELNSKLNGRGGGNKNLVQGTVVVSKDEIIEFFNFCSLYY